ncbi:helix-turn-helix domain-containing protein [Rhizobium leguminosarum]|uniref:helix-turn-helix domain-containing protein n=2 Tax=Rhizobium leguminosarum TaxID=384 RepID=UPI003F9C57CD
MTTEAQYTMAEAAAILKISIKTLREHVKLGRIRSILVGTGKARKHRRFTDKNIHTFQEAQKVREIAPCQSSSTPKARFIKSSFGSTVIPFEALQKPETRRKQKL